MEVQVATDENFEALVAENERIVVKFHASWCGKCRLFKAKYKRIAKEEEYQHISFLDVNAEENPETRKSAGVTHLPTFVIYQDGKRVDSVTTGEEDAFRDLLNKIK